MSWQNLDKSCPDSAHYSVMKCVVNEMTALREMFPDAKADNLNFVLFSTSGVHGTYMTIEDAEKEGTDVTFVIVHPRLVSMRYGNVQPETPDDWTFLKTLRQSSWDVVKQIGSVTQPQQQQAAPGAVPDGWRAVADDVSSRVIEVLAGLALAPVLSKQIPESNRSLEYIDRDLVVKSIQQIRRAVSELAEYSRLSAAPKPQEPGA